MDKNSDRSMRGNTLLVNSRINCSPETGEFLVASPLQDLIKKTVSEFKNSADLHRMKIALDWFEVSKMNPGAFVVENGNSLILRVPTQSCHREPALLKRGPTPFVPHDEHIPDHGTKDGVIVAPFLGHGEQLLLVKSRTH
ncbi:hypothetical protein chiPu_0027202 [Chiloscyllium punctatum]|uniref:Uncharacterized protein n=1 Tax=Chiloscyllium punctatum TaxID=137246 RepID=A0A401TJS4_CHIPU|nr:hypothetical protein [Chiloscyllium punctatum]